MSPSGPRLDESVLLADAFEVEPRALRLISREPLGSGGSVAGFEVTHPGADGESGTTIAYVDTSGIAVPVETGLVLEGVARVWTHPADPHLPALIPAAFGSAVQVLLSRLGITAEGPPEMAGYRPGRRCVLRVPADGGQTWIKVVRPGRVERIVDAHVALRRAGLPVPAVRGWSPDGILVLDQAAGTPATEVDWDPAALLAEADRMRAALATAPAAWDARTGVPGRLTWYSERLVEAAPDERARIEALRAPATRALADEPVERIVVHGDLHIGQLFLEGAGADIRISGIIDADTAGRGDRAEDAAAFLSHAAASALLTEGMAGIDRIWALAEGARTGWRSPRVDALAIVHLMGHALAAAEHGHPRRAGDLLALAEAIRDDHPLRDVVETRF